MLGGRSSATGGASRACGGVDAGPPSFRVPGASKAACAAAAGAGSTSWADAAKRAASSSGAPTLRPGGAEGAPARRSDSPAAYTDSEGFQEVVRRRGRKPASAASQGGADNVDMGPADTSDPRQGEGAGPEGGEAGGDGTDEPAQPTAADLQRAWQDEQALVKRLRSQGLHDDHPVMRAACGSRDAAEQAWRSTKEPAPASVRLGRAQSKLDRAVALQADARPAMQATEREYRERMAAHQETLQECADRVRLRRQQLREVQDEVGAGGRGATGAQRAQQAAIRKVHEAISGEVGPTIAALVEQIDSDTPAWATLNALLGTLAASKETLEQASVQSPAEFHIGEAEGQQGGEDAASEWSESHELQGQHWGGGPGGGGDDYGGSEHPWGHDRREWEGAQGTSDDLAQPMDTDDWWGAPARRWGGAASRWEESGHGKWTRASWADQLEEEGEDADGDEGDRRPTARRRVGPAANEQPTGEACDPEEQRRRLEARIEQITNMAIDAGVSPLTAQGEELRVLDQQRLEAWVAEFLPAALLC